MQKKSRPDRWAMEQETIDEIKSWVRMGFYSSDELFEIFCEEMYEPGELNEQEVGEAIESELSRLMVEQNQWPVETDCDRLAVVLKNLNSS